MEFKLVSATDLQTLKQILTKLKQKYSSNSQLQQNFYRALPDNGQKPFAIATEKGQVKIIYQLNKQLKFTRGMQPVYHTQQLLNQADEQDLNKFQKWMVTNLEGYKTLGLNATSKNVFEPHQVYMECKNRPNL